MRGATVKPELENERLPDIIGTTMSVLYAPGTKIDGGRTKERICPTGTRSLTCHIVSLLQTTVVEYLPSDSLVEHSVKSCCLSVLNITSLLG